MPTVTGMTTRRTSRSIACLLLGTMAGLGLASTAGAGNGQAASTKVSRSGVLVENHGDNLTTHGGSAVAAYSLRSADGTMTPLDSVPAQAHGLVGRHVNVTGSDRAGTLDLGDGTLAAANGSTGGTGGVVVNALAPGVKSVAVVLINFTDDTRQPWTITQARNVVFDSSTSVNAYYQDTSDGQVSLAGDVFGYVTITKDNVGCDWSQWGSAARTAAIAAGYPLDSYTYTVYAWPRTTLCGWAGLGYLPGTSSYIDGYLDTRVVGHELGHNFGVHHASTMSCSENGVVTTMTGTCTSDEYGDPYSIMGTSTRLHNNWHRQQLGWSTGMVTAISTATYTLAPADAGTGTRLIRIPRNNGTYLNLEYRQPTGLFDSFSVTEAVTNGVSIRIAPDTTSIVQSQLVDATPTSPSSFNDSTLKAGVSFTDPLTGATITVNSVSATGANITVSYGPDDVAPSGVGAVTTTTSSTSVRLQWTAATDNRGVVGYRVSRDGTLLQTVTTTTATDATVTAGQSYVYSVAALDAAGNVGPSSTVTVTPPLPDTGAPSAPTNLKAVASTGRSVTLSWTASVDPEGSAITYTISRVGKTWTTTGTSATDKPGRGTFTYTVTARDVAGNTSPAASVTIRL